MQERIYQILRDFVAIDSLTASRQENQAAVYLEDCLRGMAYFQTHPELCGRRRIEGDHLQRDLVYAIVRGPKPQTVILTGHYDVVGVEDYGPLRELAFDIEALPARLAEMPLDAESRADLESGAWLFGRGTADMKGGLAVALACLEQYARDPQGGSLLFLAVPDEESYSAGMRAAAPLLLELAEAQGLAYELLIDLEPARLEEGRQVLSLGTVGKCLPVVLVQGKKAHVNVCYRGLNAIGLLAEIMAATELNTDFCDVSEGIATMPPTWTYLKDMKEIYDVSVPLLAAGYCNVLSFQRTPEEILTQLRHISKQAFARYIEKMQASYAKFQTLYQFQLPGINLQPKVMLYQELQAYCRACDPEGFAAFQEQLYARLREQLAGDALNYPQATIDLMREVLAFSGLTEPLVLLGFAPPYYPAMLSSQIPGKEGRIQEYYAVIAERARMTHGQELITENYMGGITDCSYAAIDKPFNYELFADNTPLWGELYDIDFAAIGRLNVPSMVFGPRGKDYHQMTERVLKQDLFVRLPDLLQTVCTYIWA